MKLWFACWMVAVIGQRLLELRLAKRHARLVRSEGGYEVGASHYPRIVGVHIAFFAFLLLEFIFRSPDVQRWMTVPLAAFLLLQAARAWCIRSLGKYWNTRILVVPGMEQIRRGPYRYVRHPNYIVVTLEMLALPLMFGCWLTALIFPVLNAAVLRRRIAEEEQALVSTAAPSS